MSEVERYLNAAHRPNTERSYQSALDHFEVEFGGLLPTTPDHIARYLAHFATSLSLNTLRHRLAAIAKWHTEQGFPDPTKAPLVKKVMKGINTLHPVKEKQAKPLLLLQLEQVTTQLEQALQTADMQGDIKQQLQLVRDKALLLIGFWRGFRSDELCRLTVENITLFPGQGMELALPQSKGDRQNQGTSFKVPELSKLCPVSAYKDWLTRSGLTQGAVFRKVTHWGRIEAKGLHAGSISKVLKGILKKAGISNAEEFSSHSLRRGFATWANSHQWDVKSLMEYVGWKDVKSAMRYIDAPDAFAQNKIELSLGKIEPVAEQSALPQCAELHVHLVLSRFHKRVKTLPKAKKYIERFCLKAHAFTPLSDNEYQIRVIYTNNGELDDIVDNMLYDMHEIATNHQCFAEITISHPTTQQIWE